MVLKSDFASHLVVLRISEHIPSYTYRYSSLNLYLVPCVCLLYLGHLQGVQHLEDDQELQKRTPMSVQHIIMLLEFCLKNTHFIFQGRIYEQTEGAAISSPLSPIIVNLYMEAISTSPTPPSLWRRFVDDTFVIIKKTQKDSFIRHINSIDEKIKFTMEDSREDGSMPFWTPWSHHVQMPV